MMHKAKLDHYFCLLAQCAAGNKKVDNYDESVTGFVLECSTDRACIAEEFDTRAQIIGALRKLDVSQAHVESLLSPHNVADPAQHMWLLGDDQHYCLI